ncbi:hypothetical protein ScalyP_jg11722 [Parmales sp. scaly parma]|nr:hypothetical protein ScalyP_jg11722 [Parmales sp. scaly parma]
MHDAASSSSLDCLPSGLPSSVVPVTVAVLAPLTLMVPLAAPLITPLVAPLVAVTVVVSAVSAVSAATLSKGKGKNKISESLHPLHRSLQNITTMLDPNYWEACCPFLNVKRDDTVDSTSPLPSNQPALSSNPNTSPCNINEANKTAELHSRGFFHIPSTSLNFPQHLIHNLAKGVVQLRNLGHAASAISSYDEHWTLQNHLTPLITRITNLPPSGDCYSFYVDAACPSGFVGAHRDKPMATIDSFRDPPNNNAPKYVTVWVAVTPATPSSSCLYFVPKNHDEGYYSSGDALDVVLPDPLSWQNIFAAPCSPGDLLCFSHRVVHWASRAKDGAEPRVALSFAMSDPEFETANFVQTPYPPLKLRVGLTAAQAIMYNSQVPMHKHELALNNRIFMASKGLFHSDYAQRISQESQYLKYKAKNAGVAKKIDMNRN